MVFLFRGGADDPRDVPAGSLAERGSCPFSSPPLESAGGLGLFAQSSSYSRLIGEHEPFLIRVLLLPSLSVSRYGLSQNCIWLTPGARPRCIVRDLKLWGAAGRSVRFLRPFTTSDLPHTLC